MAILHLSFLVLNFAKATIFRFLFFFVFLFIIVLGSVDRFSLLDFSYHDMDRMFFYAAINVTSSSYLFRFAIEFQFEILRI
ncbi:Uncharacterised protein [Serratia liquefaciens]|nr:Uncharacterised protein [Serratia liquefaciens]